MRSIDKKYLLNAKKIHVNFLSITKDLEKEQDKLSKVKNKLKSIVEELNKTNEKLKFSRDKNNVQPVFKILDDLEIQYQKIQNIIKPLLDKVNSLRKEENVLYDFLVKSYPELSPDQIKQQVKNYVFEKAS